MKESKADLILHPVRMRVIGLLVGGRHLTAQQIAESLTDVPQASLYRHLNKLLDGGILYIAAENRIRGTTEKVYALSEQQANLTQEELDGVSREDHMRYFMTFVASLIGDFGRYLNQDNFDLLADGVGYRFMPLYLSDEEFVEFASKLRAVYLEALANQPAPGRRRRVVSTIIIPEAKSPGSKEEE